MNFYIQDTLEIFLKMPKMTALRNTFLLGLHRQVDPCEFEASLVGLQRVQRSQGERRYLEVFSCI